MADEVDPADRDEEVRLAAIAARERLRRLPKMSSGPRDVRKGDRWLPWHYGGEK